ncbi:tetratricopeptide repeat-containing sulfotransferase family protein [Marivita geojedonensis]|uniref:tetratricopeptide repeat-containing sulfotransferase family protein n=1 Tax=Marivita geojedonensis TaxID=1123756 RepID=UPI000A1D91CB|nr:sulfotransferase [Marivita geojedonensis]PRY80717.1 tetratricopeptide repeat protein [Marivita geojedonensis]
MQNNPALAIKTTYDKALALARDGNDLQAAALLDGLLLQAPNLPEIHYQRARIAARLGDQDKRLSAIDRAVALRPSEQAILTEAIAAHSAAGNHETVLSLYDKQIALDPKAIKPQAEKALYLQTAGQFDESEKLLRKLQKKHPYDAELYRMLATTIRIKPNDPMIGAMRRLANHPRLSATGRMHINFALAKAMEDTKNTSKVFPHLRLANKAQADLWPDDPEVRKAERDGVLKAQDGLRPLQDAKGTDPALIFVTGLPRSGTTLVEQIIASHSRVHAGGEMATALRCAYASFGTGADMRPLAEEPSEHFKAFIGLLGRANVPFVDQTKPCLTDKSIMAFMIYGLLHATLPNARFIVVHRDPRDIALSIYKNHFKGGTHRYANDLATIAEVIKAFRQVISHWRDTLPDRFAEVRYEDLVSDPELQSRRVIEAAGLEWEDECLNFHEKGGTVKTLSLHQVRQPIYKSSTAAWRRYETEMQPFIDAWGDTPWD